jgi:hypothetical protein
MESKDLIPLQRFIVLSARFTLAFYLFGLTKYCIRHLTKSNACEKGQLCFVWWPLWFSLPQCDIVHPARDIFVLV